MNETIRNSNESLQTLQLSSQGWQEMLAKRIHRDIFKKKALHNNNTKSYRDGGVQEGYVNARKGI